MVSNFSPEPNDGRSRQRIRYVLLLMLALILTACADDEELPELGPRPAADLATVVEAYLQRYQPGPLPRLFQTTYIYDRNGGLLAELYDDGRRTWVPLSRISPYLIDATVATEDATFFINVGIDPIRVAGAAMQNMEQGEIISGASTITMQLARNLFLGADDRYDQSFDRKIIEVGLARELTEMYSKAEVLEMYLNLNNYSHLTYGPEAAARTYFGKSAADLSLAEATMLAGIPQQPAILDPFVNFQAVKQRQRTVLDLMVRHNYLTQAEADAAFAEPITLNRDPDLVAIQAPHFVNYLVDELDSRLGQGFLRRAGLHIYTSLDLKLQEVAQAIVTRQVAELQPTYDLNNGALVAMKPGTGEILAMVGSADYNNEAIAGQVNVATRLRQPGSAIKPVLYATALNDNLVSPATVIWDTPVSYKIEGEPDYRPRNYDGDFHGPVTIRTALANSYNVPAVKLLAQVGVQHMLQSAQAMGIQSLQRDAQWYGLSLTLGGGEVTLLDLSVAFHTLANEGIYLPPRPVLAMANTAGASMMDALEYGSGQQVISKAAAFLVTDMLSDNEARIPEFGANNQLILSVPAAAKTGTTNDNRDNWTVGYTQYLLTGVWVGNTQGRPMRGNATGNRTATPIWHEFMQTVIDDPDLRARIGAPDDLEDWNFVPPPDVELRADCPTGLVCRQGGGEYFAKEWLGLADASGGPLSDSVVTAPSFTVYRGNQLVGYCLADGGVVRTLFRLPARLGLPGTIRLPGDALAAVGERQASINADVVADSSNVSVNLEESLIDLAINSRGLDEEMLQDRRNAMSYTARVRGQISLGPCDEVQGWLGAVSIAGNESGSSNATVKIRPMAPAPTSTSTSAPTSTTTAIPTDLPAAPGATVTPSSTSTPAPIATPTPSSLPPTPTATPAPPSPTATPTAVEPSDTPPPNQGRYQLANLYHDDNCPGLYLMGRVINWNGGPVAGIPIRLVDGWGNTYETVSKSTEADFGLFDFPLYSDSPQDLKITVLDGNGNPISPTIVIPHNRSGESDYPCHHITLQGG